MFHFSDYGLDPDMVLLIALGVILLMFILIIVLFAKLSGTKKKMNSFMGGADGKSLEDAFRKKFENMDYINGELGDIERHLEMIDRNLMITFQKFSIIKYDAFQSGGGQLSFVLAMLTKEDNGFIMNTVHSNSTEGYFCYLKEVKGGRALLELSDEEAAVLEQALGQ